MASHGQRDRDDTVAGLETNTLWDGLFHTLAWAVSAVGALLVWRARARAREEWSLRSLAGPALAGWGAFNCFDQLVFHLAIGAHHIRQVDDYAVYDWSFFAFGVALIVVGALVAPRGVSSGSP